MRLATYGCAPGRMTELGILYEGTFNEWMARVRSSCKLRQLMHVYEPSRTYECGAVCTCRSEVDTASTPTLEEWKAEMRLLISPWILDRILEPGIASDHSGSGTARSPKEFFNILKRVSGHFRIMDLPPELRRLVWSYTTGFWAINLSLGDTPLYDAPPLLRVSQDVCREVSPLMRTKILLCSTARTDDQLIFANLRNLIAHWTKTSSLLAINHLSQVALTMLTWQRELYEFTFVINRPGDFKLKEWRYVRSPCTSVRAQSPALLHEIESSLEDTTQALMRRKNAKTRSNSAGLCMFQVIIANESNWLKLLDKTALHCDFETMFGTDE